MKGMYHFLFFTLFVFLTACKTQKRPVASPSIDLTENIDLIDSVKIDNSKELLKIKAADSIAYVKVLNDYFPAIETMDMKGLMYLQTGSESYNFNVTIRIIKDSVVWIQIKKLGLEGARIQATKDSLTIIDRLKRSYIQKSWDQVHAEFKAPLQLTSLIQILLGQPLLTDSAIRSFDYEENNWCMVSSAKGIEESIYYDPTQMLLNNIVIYERQKDNRINIKLNDYKILSNNKKFSYLRDLELYSNKEKKLYVNLEIQETKANGSVKVPFEIPVGYKRSE